MGPLGGAQAALVAVAAALVAILAPAAPQMRDTQGNPGPRPILLHCPNWPLASVAAAAALAAAVAAAEVGRTKAPAMAGEVVEAAGGATVATMLVVRAV